MFIFSNSVHITSRTYDLFMTEWTHTSHVSLSLRQKGYRPRISTSGCKYSSVRQGESLLHNLDFITCIFDTSLMGVDLVLLVGKDGINVCCVKGRRSFNSDAARSWSQPL